VRTSGFSFSEHGAHGAPYDYFEMTTQ